MLAAKATCFAGRSLRSRALTAARGSGVRLPWLCRARATLLSAFANKSRGKPKRIGPSLVLGAPRFALKQAPLYRARRKARRTPPEIPHGGIITFEK
jgi:hypothetical protein